jgi:catechol 2,3-dioxygenase-like lactoylglutathione lyase family enzyme
MEARTMAAFSNSGPFGRFHHIAYVAKNPEVSRHFYEDILGIPLVATWAEVNEFPEFPGRRIEYCHTFYELDDGSAFAFFSFADPEVYETYRRLQSPFIHMSVKASAETIAKVRAKLEAEKLFFFAIDHGYVSSLYVPDPDGLVFELSCDPANAGEIAAWQRKTARVHLDKWVGGDRSPNNDLRTQGF